MAWQATQHVCLQRFSFLAHPDTFSREVGAQAGRGSDYTVFPLTKPSEQAAVHQMLMQAWDLVVASLQPLPKTPIPVLVPY